MYQFNKKMSNRKTPNPYSVSVKIEKFQKIL